MVTAKKEKRRKKRYPGCLAHAVNGMVYSVVPIQRQAKGGDKTSKQRRRTCSIDPGRTFEPQRQVHYWSMIQAKSENCYTSQWWLAFTNMDGNIGNI